MGMQFDHVAINKRANVYAEGKCISYTLTFPDRTVKTVGVVMPGGVTFAADTDETVEIVDGLGQVRVGHEGAWTRCQAGYRFHVSAQTRFEIEAEQHVHYVTHMGKGQAPS